MKQPVWLDERDGLALHDRMLSLFGGASGVRDPGLLKSAMARPQQHYAYGSSHSITDLAAIYTVGIVRNHPFVDGNKRTGFLLGVLFLELNGYRFQANEEDAAQAVLSVANGKMTESGHADFLRANSTRGKRKK